MVSISYSTVFLGWIIFSSVLLTILAENEFKININDINGKIFMKKFSKFLFSPEAKEHSKCIADFTKFYLALRKRKEIWPFQMLDSWGKIPSGIGTGNIHHFGQYEECLDINEKNIKGKYCKINFPINVQKIIKSLPQTNTSMNQLERIKEAEKYLDNQTKTEITPISGLAYKMGICIPHECSVDFVKKILPWAFEIVNVSLDFTIEEKYCVTDEPQKWETIDYIAISIFGFFAILMLISTMYDLMTNFFSKKEITNRYHSLFVSFSIWTNTIKLTSTNENSKSFKCFNGLKALSLLWIMFGHRLLVIGSFPLVSITYFSKLSQSYKGALITGGRFGTDTFFVLGGCLVGFSALKKYNKDKKIDIIPFYLYRFIRLTPPFAALILFHVSLLKFVGDGPGWLEMVNELSSICEKQWWAALLYMQNYLDPKHMCMNQTWYLCADMQLYILSPLLIYPLLRWRKFGLINMTLWILVSQIVTFAIAYHYKLIAAVIFYRDVIKRIEVFDFMTHTRATPWLMGFSLGYFLYSKSGADLKIRKVIVAFFWVTSLAIICACSLAMKSLMDDDHEMSYIEDTTFLAFSRTGWSMAIIWIVIACIYGYGGPMNWFLSLRIWEVLSRLTYCMYLIHFVIMCISIGSLRKSIFVTDTVIFTGYISDVLKSIFGAYVLAMMFEYPVMNLTSIAISKKKPKVTKVIIYSKTENEKL